MSTDLNRALSDVADQATDSASALPVDALLFQRRRRRTVHRSFATGGVAAGLAAVAVVAGQLTGTPEPVQPATPTPTPTVSPSPTATPVAMPVCGGRVDDVPVELTLDATDVQTLGTPLTGTVTGASGDVQLLLLLDGVVVAMPAEGVDVAGGADLQQAMEACGGALAAREYQVVAVLDGEAGAVRSEAVSVVLVEPEVVDPTADWEPLPDPFDIDSWRFGVDSWTTATPTAAEPLPDGRYALWLSNIDPITRSFDALVTISRSGQDALEWAVDHRPDEVRQLEDGTLELYGSWVLHEESAFGTQRMQMPDDTLIVGFCYPLDENLPMFEMREQTLEGLMLGDPSCGYSSNEDSQNAYFMDIRDGEIQQIVGRFLS